MLATVGLVACQPPPSGPGRSIEAAQSSIRLDHPLYQGVQGEYTQRTLPGPGSAQTESASFLGRTGFVLVNYGHAAGDTYFAGGNLGETAKSIGDQPETNEIVAEGTLPDSYPPVTWLSFTANGGEGLTMSCIALQRAGSGGTSAGSFGSSFVTATECRDLSANLGEREAAVLSGAIRIGR